MLREYSVSPQFSGLAVAKVVKTFGQFRGAEALDELRYPKPIPTIGPAPILRLDRALVTSLVAKWPPHSRTGGTRRKDYFLLGSTTRGLVLAMVLHLKATNRSTTHVHQQPRLWASGRFGRSIPRDGIGGKHAGRDVRHVHQRRAWTRISRGTGRDGFARDHQVLGILPPPPRCGNTLPK